MVCLFFEVFKIVLGAQLFFSIFIISYTSIFLLFLGWIGLSDIILNNFSYPTAHDDVARFVRTDDWA